MPGSIAAISSAIVNFTLVRHPILILTAILAFTIWCFMCDNRGLDEHKHPFTTLLMIPFILVGFVYMYVMEECLGIKNPVGTGSLTGARARSTAARWITAVCRIYAKNVRLFFRLILGALLLISIIGAAISILSPKSKPLANGGGPESEKFYRFMNTTTAPLQWIVDGIRLLLGILAIIFLAAVYFAGKVLAFSPMITLAVITLVYLCWLWISTRKIVEEEFGDEATLAHAVLALIPAELGTWIIFILSMASIYGAVVWIGHQIPA